HRLVRQLREKLADERALAAVGGDLFKEKRRPKVTPRPLADEAARKATAKALEWLAGQQNGNRSWNDNRYPHNTRIPASALLAFLSQGQLPGDEKYGQHVTKAAKFLLASARPDGYLIGTRGGNMYNHALATQALTELYVQTGEERLRPVLEKAVDLILRSQGPKGGWRYQPRPVGGATSVTAIPPPPL